MDPKDQGATKTIQARFAAHTLVTIASRANEKALWGEHAEQPDLNKFITVKGYRREVPVPPRRFVPWQVVAKLSCGFVNAFYMQKGERTRTYTRQFPHEALLYWATDWENIPVTFLSCQMLLTTLR